MYVSAPTIFGSVTLPPVQAKFSMNWAVSGWLNLMKLITESRTFSCVGSSEGLGVGVGLTEVVGVVVGEIGVEACGGADGKVEVGVGENVGSGEVVEAFGEGGCVAAK
jgi:hypothetical protein